MPIQYFESNKKVTILIVTINEKNVTSYHHHYKKNVASYWSWLVIILLFMRKNERFLNSLKHVFFLDFNGLEIRYSRDFGVADYESELKIQ